MTTRKRTQQMPAFLSLPLTAHEIGYRMSAPSLRAGLALSSQHPPCADAAIADITAGANGEHQPARAQQRRCRRGSRLSSPGQRSQPPATASI
jgi:hypothetical protein